MKKYKAVPPEETIIKLKNILNNIGIITNDSHMNNGIFYSCRISIGNLGIFDLSFGSNGKGRNFEYSAASGYAEFLERLQNRFMLSNRRDFAHKNFLSRLPSNSEFVNRLRESDNILKFLYDPKEEYWVIEDVLENNIDEIKHLYNLSSYEESKDFLYEKIKESKLTMIPFYSVFDNNTKLLPYELILTATGSNGMCAGNTALEAILQGICELFERYAVTQIFYKKINPPVIPLSYFEGTPIHEKVTKLLENPNYEIIIKDCSLGIGLPVIGVIIIDKQTQKYNFSLGSDCVPSIALERCLTEVYQNSEDFIGITGFSDLTSILEQSEENNTFMHLRKTTLNSSGLWPTTIFKDEHSYSFNGFNPDLGKSNDEDMSYCLDIIKTLGYNIYIRDNSFLGFPSYHIVIPGMSQFSNDKQNYTIYKQSFQNVSLLTMLGNKQIDNVKILIQILEDNYEIIKIDNYDLSKLYLYNTDSDLLDLDLDMLLFMLLYYVGDVEKACKYFENYLTDKERDEYTYYYAIGDFVKFRYKLKLSLAETESILEKFYNKDIAKEVIEDMENPNDIFNHYNFPSCFNCEVCQVKQTCHYFEVIDIENKLNKAVETANIDQAMLSKVFF